MPKSRKLEYTRLFSHPPSMLAFLSRWWLFALCLAVLIAGYVGLAATRDRFILKTLGHYRFITDNLLLAPVLLKMTYALLDCRCAAPRLVKLLMIDVLILYAVPILLLLQTTGEEAALASISTLVPIGWWAFAWLMAHVWLLMGLAIFAYIRFLYRDWSIDPSEPESPPFKTPTP